MSQPEISGGGDLPQLPVTQIVTADEQAVQLAWVLDQYLAELKAGRQPDRGRLLADYPHLAVDLEQCLPGVEFIYRASGKSLPGGALPAQLGDFRIIREVGRGGMGVVYEAEQISLKRRVALKVLRFGAAADSEAMQRFQREAETVATLHHTNIVPIFAIGSEQGVNYYAMQFIAGRSLAEVLQQRESNAGVTRGVEWFREVAGWMLQGAEALAHAHQRGVIHRDVKPSNLILDDAGTVWLTDFGLAKRADEVTMTVAGVLMGTPRYMSPEQAAATRQPIDHRTDIYSLGATLYELATGQPVFDSQTPQGIITQILHSEPVSPRILQGKLPRDLETIILKCLAKEPAKRYLQARDLAEDLRSWLANRPILARRASLFERGVRWLKKHQRSTLTSGISAVVSIVLLIGGLLGWNAYQKSLLGRLSLSTDGPSLVAEVLNDEGELVVPGFPVPNAQPVELLAGTYRVRLSGAGLLSEVWQLDVKRGQTAAYNVKLLDRLLGPPLALRENDYPTRVALNGHMNIFQRGDRSWRLTRGETLTPAWGKDLAMFPERPEEAPYPQTAISGAWHDLLQVEGASIYGETGRSPGIAQPAVDADGDGQDDLILASRVSPSFVAVSGTDGRVLWWYRAMPNLPAEYNEAEDPIDFKASSEEAGVIGTPISVTIQGEPAVVAPIVSHRCQLNTKSGNHFIALKTYYLEAVAARTGKQLWRAVLELPEVTEKYQHDVFKVFAPQPVVTTSAGQSVILLWVNDKVLSFDPQTGKEFWPTRDVGESPLQQVQLGDLNGDQQPDAVNLYFADSMRQDQPTVQAVSLASNAVLWQKTFYATDYLHTHEILPAGSELVWLLDIDGDGRQEVVLPARDEWQTGGQHWFGITVLDGGTGEVRWERRLWESSATFGSSGGSSGSVRVSLGPDLNGDGFAELFATGTPPDFLRPNNSLLVSALSGSDGRILWQQGLANNQGDIKTAGAPLWWQTGPDGWPQLVVSIQQTTGAQPMTYVLSATTGKLTATLAEVAQPVIADFNSDGIADLSYLTRAEGARQLVVLKGLPPVFWRRPGTYQPATDGDGDGSPDLLQQSDGRLQLRQSHTGELLWQTPQGSLRFLQDGLFVACDVNGDGIDDIITPTLDQSGNRNTTAVRAFSGRDGTQLWANAGSDLTSGSSYSSGGWIGSEFRYPCMDLVDLDGDSQPEILAAAFTSHLNSVSLEAFSSSDGRLLWKVPILKGAYMGESLIDRRLWHDLNGDGVLDIVLWVPASIGEHGVSEGAELQSISGRDGSHLWKEPGHVTLPEFAWPRTALADLDHDGQVEVVATAADHSHWGPDGYPHELVVLNGRDGTQKWRWAWSVSNTNFWPPVLADFAGSKTYAICLAFGGKAEGVTDKQSNQIVLLDHQGQVREVLPTGWITTSPAWAALDLDGDGKDELVYEQLEHDPRLLAYGGKERGHLWQRPVTANGVTLEDFRAPDKQRPGELRLWSSRTIFGCDPATGTPRWRCDVPRQDSYQLISDVLGKSQLQPLVSSTGAGTPTTLVQQSWRTSVDGKYMPPASQPIEFKTYVESVRARASNDAPFRGLPQLPLVGVLIAFVQLLYWLATRRWLRVGLYLLAYGLLSLLMLSFVVTVLTTSPEGPGTLVFDGWEWGLFLGASALGWLTAATGLVRLAWRLLGLGWRTARRLVSSTPER